MANVHSVVLKKAVCGKCNSGICSPVVSVLNFYGVHGSMVWWVLNSLNAATSIELLDLHVYRPGRRHGTRRRDFSSAN